MSRIGRPEKLHTFYHQLTRTQARKVAVMGGSAWLRKLISDARAARTGVDYIDLLRARAARDKDIVSSTKPSWELAADYKLSIKRVQQIRREHRNER